MYDISVIEHASHFNRKTVYIESFIEVALLGLVRLHSMMHQVIQ